MAYWLKLIRWPNLLMIILALCLIKYALLPYFDFQSVVTDEDFMALCATVVFVTIAGNIINDIQDIKADFINQRQRPLAQQKINVSQAYILFFISNIIGIFLSIYLSYKYDFWSISIIVFTVMILLYSYSKYIKQIPFVGNVLVSVLVSFSFLLIAFFELYQDSNFIIEEKLKYTLLGYAVFSFWVNLNREIVKDIIDIKGDYSVGTHTLPIVFGRLRTNAVLFLSTLSFLFVLIYVVKVYFSLDLVFILYLTFGIAIPLVVILYLLWKDQEKANYKLISHLYKVVMLMGVCSLLLFLS